MSLELVREVKNAEARAETLKKEAQAQAKQILLDNQKACASLLEKAQKQAGLQKSEALQAAETAAEQEGAIRRSQVLAQCEEIAQAAAARMDRAVDIVVERIVSG